MRKFVETETVEWKNTSGIAANDSWVPEGFTPSTNELYELVSLELFPPQNSDGTLQTVERIRPMVADNYPTAVNAREFQLPYSSGDPSAPASQVLQLGVPVLTGEGYAQPAFATCPKAKYTQELTIQVDNDGTAIDDNFMVRGKLLKFRGNNQQLRQATGQASSSVSKSVSVTNPYTGSSKQVSMKMPVTLEDFDALPGGVSAEKPYPERWVTWATNANATTANTRYTLDYESGGGNVAESWQEMYFNADTSVAYLIETLAVDPASNQANTIIELNSRADEKDVVYETRPDATNQLWPAMPTDGADVNAVPNGIPTKIQPMQKVFDDKGGVTILDDGSSVSAGNALIGLRGWKLTM